MSNTNFVCRSVKCLPLRGSHEYKPGEIVEIHVDPQSVQLINPYETYLRYTFKIAYVNAYVVPDSRVGAIGIIKNCTILSGDSQTIISQLRSYSDLLQLFNHTTENSTIKNIRALTEGVEECPITAGKYNSTSNKGGGIQSQYFIKKDTDTDVETKGREWGAEPVRMAVSVL